MQSRQNTDQFEEFRRKHQRIRAKRGGQTNASGYENSALRELEQQEAAEERDQQLTREVHDFFAEATRQAATIVEQVSHDAEEQASKRMQGEVEGFLMDTLTRMNNFIMAALRQRKNPDDAEAHVEPDVKHLVGSELDEFRYAGSPEARNTHIGQDPFATPIEDVQREFRAVVADASNEDDASGSIESPPVTEACNYDSIIRAAMDADEQDTPTETVPVQSEPLVTDNQATQYEDASDIEDTAVDPAADPDQMMRAMDSDSRLNPREGDPSASDIQDDLKTFKSALKALVRQGVMQREEARAAWNARLQATGRAG